YPFLINLLLLSPLCLYLKRKDFLLFILIFSIFYLIGLKLFFFQGGELSQNSLKGLQVKILKAEPFYDKFKVIAEVKEMEKIEFTTKIRTFSPGQICEISLKEKSSFKVQNPYTLELRERLLIKDLRGEWILDEKEKVLCIDSEGGIIEKIRYRLFTFSEYLSPLARGLFLALVLGVENQLPKEYLEKLKTQGLYHHLAISGFNLGIVYGFLYKVFKKTLVYTPLLRLGLPIQIWAYLFALPGAAFILILSGFQPPTQRAFFFLFCFVINKVLFRNTPSLYILLLAASLIIITSPTLIGNLSFQLSFLATLAIIIGHNLYKEKIEKFLFQIEPNYFLGRVLFKIFYAFFLSIIVSLFTFPFLLSISGYFPLATPINNLLVSAFWSFLFIPLSIISAFLAFVSPSTAISLMEFNAWLFNFYIKIPLFEWLFSLPLPVNLFLLWLSLLAIFILLFLKFLKSKILALLITLLVSVSIYVGLYDLHNRVDYLLIPKFFHSQVFLIKDKKEYFLFVNNENDSDYFKSQLITLLRKLGVREIREVYINEEGNLVSALKENFEVIRFSTSFDVEIMKLTRVFKPGVEIIPIEGKGYLIEFKGLSFFFNNSTKVSFLAGFPFEVFFTIKKTSRGEAINSPVIIYEKQRMKALYFFPKDDYFLLIDETNRRDNNLLKLFFPLFPYILEGKEKDRIKKYELQRFL
ncbi:MAG: ComEC/Rec2 family competence protein, partial [Caldimicrobium sp.]